jgi:hypothetical protein
MIGMIAPSPIAKRAAGRKAESATDRIEKDPSALVIEDDSRPAMAEPRDGRAPRRKSPET